MGTSLMALRQELGKDLGACETGVVESAGAQSFTDPTKADSTASVQKYNGWWFYATSGLHAGATHRIASWENLSGVFNFTRPWTVWPRTGGFGYEMHSLLSIDDLNRCVNRGLARCTYLHYHNFNDLPTSTTELIVNFQQSGDIIIPQQIVDVYYRTADTTYPDAEKPWANVSKRVRVKDWRVAGMAPYVKVLFPSGLSYEDVIVEAIESYPSLGYDAAATACPKEWVKSAAAVELWKMLSEQAPADDVARYDAKQAKAAATFSEWSRQFAPRPTKIVRLGHSLV